MINTEQSLEFDPFALDISFDINAAFQEAAADVLSDEALELEERVSRVQTILSEAQSDTYEAFVDFRMLATQVEMFCNHDHAFRESFSQNSPKETFSHQLDAHRDHHHDHALESKGIKKQNDKKESKKKEDRKKKKRKSWFGFYY